MVFSSLTYFGIVKLANYVHVPGRASHTDLTNDTIQSYNQYYHYGALGAAVLGSGYEYLKYCLDPDHYDLDEHTNTT